MVSRISYYFEKFHNFAMISVISDNSERLLTVIDMFERFRISPGQSEGWLKWKDYWATLRNYWTNKSQEHERRWLRTARGKVTEGCSFEAKSSGGNLLRGRAWKTQPTTITDCKIVNVLCWVWVGNWLTMVIFFSRVIKCAWLKKSGRFKRPLRRSFPDLSVKKAVGCNRPLLRSKDLLRGLLTYEKTSWEVFYPSWAVERPPRRSFQGRNRSDSKHASALPCVNLVKIT